MSSKHNKKSKRRRPVTVKKIYLKQKNKNSVLKSKKNRKGGGGEEVDKLSIKLSIDGEPILDLEVNETDNIIPTIKKHLISNNYTLFGNEDIESFCRSFGEGGKEFVVDPIVYFGEERIEEIFLSFSESGIEDGARLNVKRIEERDDIIINLRMKINEMINYIVGIKEKQDRKLAQRAYFINISALTFALCSDSCSHLNDENTETAAVQARRGVTSLFGYLDPWCRIREDSVCDDYIYERLTTIFSEKIYNFETRTYELNDLMKKEMRLIFKSFLQHGSRASATPQLQHLNDFPRVYTFLTEIL